MTVSNYPTICLSKVDIREEREQYIRSVIVKEKLNPVLLLRTDYTECYLCNAPMTEQEESKAYFIHVSNDNQILNIKDNQKNTLGWHPVGSACGCCGFIPKSHKTK